MRRPSEDLRRRLPWVAFGLTVTLTTAIIFGLWASSLSSRTAVAVARRDIATGSTVVVDDIRAVEMAVGQGAEFVPIADLDSVIGQTVRTTVPEGTILHPALLLASPSIGRDQAVVGAVLHPGEYPVALFGPGQTVGVVVTGDHGDPIAVTGFGPDSLASELDVHTPTTQAVVAEISRLPDSGREALFVSLLATAEDAVLISKAAATNNLRLILLPHDPISGVNTSQQATAGTETAPGKSQ